MVDSLSGRRCALARAQMSGGSNGFAPFALLLGTSVFAAYALTLPPSFGFWDTGELQTVSWILGIAHPPACPAFVLAGYAFAHLVQLRTPAWRVNLMCALAVALSVATLYSTAREMGRSRGASILCALGFAFAFVTWRNATRAEIQDLSLLFRGLAFACALRWFQAGEVSALFRAGLAAGLAGATHGIALLLLPSLAMLIFARSGWRNPRALGALAGGAALGLLPYAYLPLRSMWVQAHHLDPTVALGLPPGLPFWDYDHPATWPNFVRVVTGADFNVRSGFAGFVSLPSYAGYASALAGRLGDAYGLVGFLLATIGGYLLVASRRIEALALVVAGLLPVPYTQAYSELQDRDRYYLFTLWCAAIAIGVAFDRLMALFDATRPSVPRFIAFGVLAASFVTAGSGHGEIFAQRYDEWAPRYVALVTSLVPDGSVILAEWAYATPLAYAAYVENDLGERVVVTAGPLQYAGRIKGWLARRRVYVISLGAQVAIPGLRVEPVYSGPFFAYRVTE